MNKLLKLKSISTIAIILISIFYINSCGGSDLNNDGFEDSNTIAPIRINVIPSEEALSNRELDLTNAAFVGSCEFSTITVTVSGDFNTSPITQTFSEEPGGGFSTIVVTVPAGPMRTFGIALGDCCSGQTTIDVIPDQTTTVSISCDIPDEICTNGVDDDLDGLVDCADLDDCDGLVCDPNEDGVCVDGECLSPIELPETNCSNGIDDDLDGFTDCADGNCAFDPACTQEEICFNGQNDDPLEDFDVDCADSDCEGSIFCMTDPSLSCSSCGPGCDGQMCAPGVFCCDGGCFCD